MLIIIESPGKKSSIEKYTGAKVMASFGHFKDLPGKELGVDLETFDPSFSCQTDRHNDVRKKLIAAAKGEDVYIASDKDREGDAIGVMVYEEIKKVAKSVKRAYFGEISKDAVLKGIKDAIPFENFDFNIYKSFLGRRVADRLVGYLLSGVAHKGTKWGKSEDYMSVGRVQTAGVKILVERELEIQNFKPEDYYIVKAILEHSGATFIAEHATGKFKDQAAAKAAAMKAHQATSALVLSVDKTDSFSAPKPPYITSTLQAEGSTRLNLTAAQTMFLAQKLYEGFGDGGFITYMRTDSTTLSEDFLASAATYLKANFPNGFKETKQHKSKNSQAEAHEAIRPSKPLSDYKSDMAKIKNGLLKAGEKETVAEGAAKLYEMIVLRTLASQMIPAKFAKTVAKIDIDGEPFVAKGSILIDPGYKALFGDAEESEEDSKLPNLSNNDVCTIEDVTTDSKKTTPPSRYSEPALIAKLEKDGVGRPSTYATIMTTLINKNYAKTEKKVLVPLEKAMVLIKFLDKEYPFISDIKFTAEMEEFLDNVAEGKKNWKDLMSDLYVKMGSPKPGGSGGQVTEKMINFAKVLAEKLGRTVPEECLTDFGKMKDLLDKWSEEHRQTNPGGNGLSPKQLEIINKNAPQEIIDLIGKDYTKVKKWLDDFFKNLKNPGGLKPKKKKD